MLLLKRLKYLVPQSRAWIALMTFSVDFLVALNTIATLQERIQTLKQIKWNESIQNIE